MSKFCITFILLTFIPSLSFPQTHDIQFDHITTADSLKDVRPVVGAQQTRPTMTWLSLFDGSANLQARETRIAAGSVQVPIESVSLDPPMLGYCF